MAAIEDVTKLLAELRNKGVADATMEEVRADIARLYTAKKVLSASPRTAETREQLLRVISLLAEYTAAADSKSRAAKAAAADAPAGTQPQQPPTAPHPLQQQQSSQSSAESDGPTTIPFDAIQLTEQIGEGSFGIVYKGQCLGQSVAVKVSKVAWSADRRDELAGEISIMRKIFHPFVVLFLGVSSAPDGRALIVSEFMPGGDLEHLIYSTRRSPLSLEHKIQLLHDAALGMAWLHNICMLVHRDLKPANLLVDAHGRVKVTDFGLSEFTKGGQDRGRLKGSPLYAAPEILLKKPFDTKIDVYSFGLVAFELMFEQQIFTQYSELEPFTEAVAVHGERPTIPDVVQQTTDVRRKQLPNQAPPPGFAEFLRACWHADPTKRPAFAEVIKMLDLMKLSIAIPDAKARDFWIAHFGENRGEVSWKEFVQTLVDDTGASKASFTQTSGLFCPKDPAVKPDTVTARRFYLVSAWFGEFYDRAKGSAIIDAAASLCRQSWFRPDISSKVTADTALSRKPEGTFLVRPSATDPIESPFTLSLVVSGNPEHSRIVDMRHRHVDGQPPAARYRVAVPKTRDAIDFNSLEMLVEDQSRPGSRLGLKVELPVGSSAAAEMYWS